MITAKLFARFFKLNVLKIMCIYWGKERRQLEMRTGGKQTTRKFGWHINYLFHAVTQAFRFSLSNLHSVIVAVSQCGKVSCYSAFWNAVDRTRSPVLCIFHIFFRVYPKNSNLSSFHQQPPPHCCCAVLFLLLFQGDCRRLFFLNWLYRVWDDGDGIEYKMNWD